MCGGVQLQCPKAEQPDSEIQPLFLSYQCVFRSLRPVSFAEPEIGLTPLLVASHATSKAVVEGCSDEAPRELCPTCLAFHMPKESEFWC